MSQGMAALSKPGGMRLLAQAGVAATPLALAYWASRRGHAKTTAALQGAGIGAAVHMISQAVLHYAIVPWLGGQSAPAAGATPTLAQSMVGYYAPEIVADNVEAQALTGKAGAMYTGGAAGSGTGTTLLQLGAFRGDALRGLRVPRALAAVAKKAGAVGACGGGCGGGGAPGNGGQPGCGDDPTECAQPPGLTQVPPPASQSDANAAAAAAIAATSGSSGSGNGVIAPNGTMGGVPFNFAPVYDNAAE